MCGRDPAVEVHLARFGESQRHQMGWGKFDVAYTELAVLPADVALVNTTGSLESLQEFPIVLTVLPYSSRPSLCTWVTIVLYETLFLLSHA